MPDIPERQPDVATDGEKRLLERALHHEHVHPFISWSVLLNALFLTLLPAALFAQQGTVEPTFGEQRRMATPPIDIGECATACETIARECASVERTDADATRICSNAAEECYSRCRSERAQPPKTLQEPGLPKNGRDPIADAAAAKAALEKTKRGMSGFVRQLAAIKARVATLEKSGVKIPVATTEALAAASALAGKISSADSQEDADALAEEMRDAAQAIRDQMPDLERLANLKKMYARIDKQLKTLERQLAQDKTLAARSKIDISGPVAEFEAALAEATKAYADAKAMIDAGDLDGGFDALETDVFDALPEVGEYHAYVQQLGRVSATIAQADRDLRASQQQIDRLKKAGKDVVAAQEIVDGAKDTLAELKIAASTKPIDAEAAYGLLKELEDARDAFQDAVRAAQGIAEKNDIDEGLKMLDVRGPNAGADATTRR